MSTNLVTIVITVFGTDRPGIIESLSRVIADNGGSWEESRMARLSGHFAGVVGVRGEEPSARKLESDLIGLEAKDLELRVQIIREVSPVPDLQNAEFALVGQDRPGILNEITAALAKRLLVIEAGESGGTMHTVGLARKIGVPVYVIRFTDPPESAAGNAIIEARGGVPITCLADIDRLASGDLDPTTLTQMQFDW